MEREETKNKTENKERKIRKRNLIEHLFGIVGCWIEDFVYFLEDFWTIILIVVVAIGIVCLWAEDAKSTQKEIEEKVAAGEYDLIVYPATSNKNGYEYVVDTKTNVVYIHHIGTKKESLSIMLNADGTPVTKEQLDLETKTEAELKEE